MKTAIFAAYLFAGLLINNLILAMWLGQVYYQMAGSPKEDNARGLAKVCLFLTLIPLYALLATLLIVVGRAMWRRKERSAYAK